MTDPIHLTLPAVVGPDRHERLYAVVVRPWRERLRERGGTSRVTRSADGLRCWVTGGPEWAVFASRIALLKCARSMARLSALPDDCSTDQLSRAMVESLRAYGEVPC